MNNRKLPRSAAEVASFGDLRKYYDKLIKQTDEIYKELRMSRAGHKGDRKELEETRTQVKKAKKIVFTLTKKQKAAEEAKKAGLWSGAAAIAVTVLYQTWKVIGFPGGYRWMEWWNHEAVFGVMMWVSTYVFATAYKIAHDDD